MPEEKPKEVPIYVDRIEVPAPRKGLRSDSVQLLGDVSGRGVFYNDLSRKMISSDLRPYVCVGRGQQIRAPRTYLSTPHGIGSSNERVISQSQLFIYPESLSTQSRVPIRSSQISSPLEPSVSSDSMSITLKSDDKMINAKKNKSNLSGKTLKDFFSTLSNGSLSQKGIEPQYKGLTSGTRAPISLIKRSRQVTDLDDYILPQSGKRRCFDDSQEFHSRFSKNFYEDQLDDLEDEFEDVDDLDDDEDDEDDDEEIIIDDGFKRMPRTRPSQTILVEEEGDIDTTDSSLALSSDCSSNLEYTPTKIARSPSPPPTSTPLLSIIRSSETRNSSKSVSSSSLPSSLSKYVPPLSANRYFFSDVVGSNMSEKNQSLSAQTMKGNERDLNRSRDSFEHERDPSDSVSSTLFRGVTSPSEASSLSPLQSYGRQIQSPISSGTDFLGFYEHDLDDPEEDDDEEDDEIDDQSDQDIEDEYTFLPAIPHHSNSQSDSYYDDLSD